MKQRDICSVTAKSTKDQIARSVKHNQMKTKRDEITKCLEFNELINLR